VPWGFACLFDARATRSSGAQLFEFTHQVWRGTAIDASRSTAADVAAFGGVAIAARLVIRCPSRKGFGEGWAGWPRAQKSRRDEYS
jgi:hypothetical protein